VPLILTVEPGKDDDGLASTPGSTLNKIVAAAPLGLTRGL